MERDLKPMQKFRPRPKNTGKGGGGGKKGKPNRGGEGLNFPLCLGRFSG